MDWLQFPWHSFDYDEHLGGSWECPIEKLPDYFTPWEEVAGDIPHLLETKQLRNQIDMMPLLDAKTLHGLPEWRRAYVILVHLTNGYIWQEGPTGKAKSLPPQLAVPVCLTAENQQLPVGFCFTAGALWNWRRIDKDGPMEIENLRVEFQYLGGEKYDWFMTVQILIDGQATQGIKAGLSAYHSVEQDDVGGLVTSLQKVGHTLNSIITTMRRIPEKVLPEDFFVNIAACYGGWGVPGFPEIVHFEGVETQPKPVPLANASYAITLEVFDAILRIQRSEETVAYQNGKHSAIPPGHCRLVDTLWTGPSVREYVLSHKEGSLVEAYNSAVKALADIREEHMQFIVRYAMNMEKKFLIDTGVIPRHQGVFPGIIGPKAIRKKTEDSYIQ